VTAVLVLDRSEFGVELEDKIVKALTKKGVNAFPTSEMARFARTQSDLTDKIRAKGATEILVVDYGDSASESVSGYQVVGSANTYRNTTYTNATAVPVRTISRRMQMQAAVYALDGTKVWEANTNKKAQGLLFTGDGTMISGSARALVDA